MNELDENDPQSYGTDRTDRRGRFRINSDLLAGEYFCRSALSARVRF